MPRHQIEPQSAGRPRKGIGATQAENAPTGPGIAIRHIVAGHGGHYETSYPKGIFPAISGKRQRGPGSETPPGGLWVVGAKPVTGKPIPATVVNGPTLHEVVPSFEVQNEKPWRFRLVPMFVNQLTQAANHAIPFSAAAGSRGPVIHPGPFCLRTLVQLVPAPLLRRGHLIPVVLEPLLEPRVDGPGRYPLELLRTVVHAATHFASSSGAMAISNCCCATIEVMFSIWRLALRFN